MKRLILATLLVAAVGIAQPVSYGPFGIGVMGGWPSGLSFKYWTGATTAFDAGLGWAFLGDNNSRIHAHGDFLYHFNDVIKVPGAMPLYLGVGARARLGRDDLGLGVRVPFGIAYMFDEIPVDLFLEYVPVFRLLPATGFDWESNAGIRYYPGSK